MPGIARPTMFDDIPMNRPHRFSHLWQEVFLRSGSVGVEIGRHRRSPRVARSSSSIERFAEVTRVVHNDIYVAHCPALEERRAPIVFLRHVESNGLCCGSNLTRRFKRGHRGRSSRVITCAPRFANANAIAWPMPWPAPVTKATRPSCVFPDASICSFQLARAVPCRAAVHQSRSCRS